MANCGQTVCDWGKIRCMITIIHFSCDWPTGQESAKHNLSKEKKKKKENE